MLSEERSGLLVKPSIILSGALTAGGCGQRTKRSREELPHVRDQGQWPRVPGCKGPGTAKRSYPMSEVRGNGWEELHRV